MNLTDINTAIDEAYNVAIANGGQQSGPQTIAPNVILQTDSYVGPNGPGFRVVATIFIPEANFRVSRVKNHGPDTQSEQDWPAEGIEAAAQAHIARCIQSGADHVSRSGFDADRKVILLNKLLKAKEENAVANFPKLTALYAWMETVQSMAIVGQYFFPKAPHSFEEVIKE